MTTLQTGSANSSLGTLPVHHGNSQYCTHYFLFHCEYSFTLSRLSVPSGQTLHMQTLRTVFCRSPPGPGLVSEAGSLSLSRRRTFQLQHQRRAVLHHARHQQRLRPTQRGEPAHRGVPAGGPVHAAERPGPVLLQPDRDEEGRQRQRSRHQVWAWPLTSLCFFYLTNAEQQSSSSSSPSSPSCVFSEAFLCFHCF